MISVDRSEKAKDSQYLEAINENGGDFIPRLLAFGLRSPSVQFFQLPTELPLRMA